KNGAGSLTLTKANIYTGPTTVNDGIFQAGIDNAFPSTSAFTIANVATASLDLNSFNQTIGSLAGGGTTGGNATLGSAVLTTGGNNTDTAYGGVISGTGSLSKAGTGTMTLSGANTYTGLTTISGGILSVAADTNMGDPLTGAAVLFQGGSLRATG